jgi:hypothetical protein
VPTISNASLTVDVSERGPGVRRIRVAYDVEWGPTDAATDVLVEVVSVHAVDEHDAPARPNDAPVIVFHRTVRPGSRTERREFEGFVHRTELDVEQDWWSTDESGATVPIAEWVDHVVADISFHEPGTAVAEARTPVVSGSWGALGAD